MEATADILTDAISEAGVELADISAVYLVGGSSRIPLVEEVLKRRFSDTDRLIVSLASTQPRRSLDLLAVRIGARVVDKWEHGIELSSLGRVQRAMVHPEGLFLFGGEPSKVHRMTRAQAIKAQMIEKAALSEFALDGDSAEQLAILSERSMAMQVTVFSGHRPHPGGEDRPVGRPNPKSWAEMERRRVRDGIARRMYWHVTKRDRLDRTFRPEQDAERRIAMLEAVTQSVPSKYLAAIDRHIEGGSAVLFVDHTSSDLLAEFLSTSDASANGFAHDLDMRRAYDNEREELTDARGLRMDCAFVHSWCPIIATPIWDEFRVLHEPYILLVDGKGIIDDVSLLTPVLRSIRKSGATLLIAASDDSSGYDEWADTARQLLEFGQEILPRPSLREDSGSHRHRLGVISYMGGRWASNGSVERITNLLAWRFGCTPVPTGASRITTSMLGQARKAVLFPWDAAFLLGGKASKESLSRYAEATRDAMRAEFMRGPDADVEWFAPQLAAVADSSVLLSVG